MDGVVPAGETFDAVVEELSAASPTCSQPDGLEIVLKPHQLTLLQRCQQIETQRIYLRHHACFECMAPSEHDYLETQVGIIGDRVGAGKSFVLIALLLANREVQSRQEVVRSFGANRVRLCTTDRRATIKTNLLVVPHGIVAQWEGYLHAAISPSAAFAVRVVSKTRAADDLLDDIKRDVDSLSKCDLLLVTATYYNVVAAELKAHGIRVQRVIFDEVDCMNLPNCAYVDSLMLWVLAASYANLLYPRGLSHWDNKLNRYVWCATGIRNAGFVRNLFTDMYFNMPAHCTRVLVVKNSDAFVDASMRLPPLLQHMVECKTPAAIRILHGLVDKCVITSLNAGDVDTAIAYVSASNRQPQESIIQLMIDRYQRSLHNLDVRVQFVTNYQYECEQDRAAELERLQAKKGDVALRVKSIKERVMHSNVCPICLEPVAHKTIGRCCGNAYCFRCINMWINNRAVCPLCKELMGSQDLLVVQEHALPVPPAAVVPEHGTCPELDKLENMERILRLRLSDNSRVLVFSSYDNSFTHMQPILQRVGAAYRFLKGNAAHVKAVTNQYRAGEVNVLLVNTRNYGSGLNLECTTDVVLTHKFDNDIERQVIGRAQRFGRTEQLNVWYLLHRNEMDHKSNGAEASLRHPSLDTPPA
jgi:SNF2 family DNA or RNA helicase